MTVDFNRLKTLSREELVTLAHQQGLQVHWKSKPETIINQIIDKVTERKPVPQQAQAENPPKPEHNNTPEDVENALESLKTKAPRLRTSYPGGNTWHFKYIADNGRTLYEESGNLAIPLKTILRRANIVSRGPLLLRGLNQHFDQLPVGGNNAYTNTVLV